VPSPRRIHFLSAYPDLILSASFSAAQYVEGPQGSSSAWRGELERQVEANRLVLEGRLYELARDDTYHVLAAVRYRRALRIVPGHFGAGALLGIVDRQLELARREAEAADGGRDRAMKWLGALAAAERLDEAARWIERYGRGEPWGPRVRLVLAMLRERPDAIKRLLTEGAATDSGERIFGVSPTALAGVAELQDAARRNPADPEAWLELGAAYEECAAAIGRSAFRPRSATQSELVGLLHSFSLQSVVTLREMAVASYERALDLEPLDSTVKYRLAGAREAVGDYTEAGSLLRSIGEYSAKPRAPVSTSGDVISMSAMGEYADRMDEMESDRFGFLARVREEHLRQLLLAAAH
jgi:tetratricopeptide (TPR) repeat protein